MANTFTYDVVIIGAGPAGMCAALYAGRSMLKAVGRHDDAKRVRELFDQVLDKDAPKIFMD